MARFEILVREFGERAAAACFILLQESKDALNRCLLQQLNYCMWPYFD